MEGGREREGRRRQKNYILYIVADHNILEACQYLYSETKSICRETLSKDTFRTSPL